VFQAHMQPIPLHDGGPGRTMEEVREPRLHAAVSERV
jgi:hypothetical protein